jgi:hypothetical protein
MFVVILERARPCCTGLNEEQCDLYWTAGWGSWRSGRFVLMAVTRCERWLELVASRCRSVDRFSLIRCPSSAAGSTYTWLSWVRLMLWSTVSRPISLVEYCRWIHWHLAELSWFDVMTNGQSAYQSWCRAPLWGPWPDFAFPFSCRTIALLFVLGRPLWREDASVICSASGQRRVGLITIRNCLIWDYWFPFPSPLTTRSDYGGFHFHRVEVF